MPGGIQFLGELPIQRSSLFINERLILADAGVNGKGTENLKFRSENSSRVFGVIGRAAKSPRDLRYIELGNPLIKHDLKAKLAYQQERRYDEYASRSGSAGTLHRRAIHQRLC